jgi:hypothetical protein
MSSDIELEKPATARKRTQADEEPPCRELAQAARLRDAAPIAANGCEAISETPTLSANLRQTLTPLAATVGRPPQWERLAKVVPPNPQAKADLTQPATTSSPTRDVPMTYTTEIREFNAGRSDGFR